MCFSLPFTYFVLEYPVANLLWVNGAEKAELAGARGKRAVPVLVCEVECLSLHSHTVACAGHETEIMAADHKNET